MESQPTARLLCPGAAPTLGPERRREGRGIPVAGGRENSTTAFRALGWGPFWGSPDLVDPIPQGSWVLVLGDVVRQDPESPEPQRHLVAIDRSLSDSSGSGPGSLPVSVGGLQLAFSWGREPRGEVDLGAEARTRFAGLFFAENCLRSG